MAQGRDGRYLRVDQLLDLLEACDPAWYVWVNAAGNLTITRGRATSPRLTVGHVDVAAERLRLYPAPETDSNR